MKTKNGNRNSRGIGKKLLKFYLNKSSSISDESYYQEIQLIS